MFWPRKQSLTVVAMLFAFLSLVGMTIVTIVLMANID